MAHPRFPRPYAICVIFARAILLCLAIVNMGSAAYLGADFPKKRAHGISIAVICAFAILVDVHPIAALLDTGRKIGRPPTALTACCDFLLAVGLVISGIFLLMSDYRYSDGGSDRGPLPWRAALGIVTLLTLIHMSCRVIMIFWACIYGCIASSKKRRAARRAAQHGNGHHLDAVALETGARIQSG